MSTLTYQPPTVVTHHVLCTAPDNKIQSQGHLGESVLLFLSTQVFFKFLYVRMVDVHFEQHPTTQDGLNIEQEKMGLVPIVKYSFQIPAGAINEDTVMMLRKFLSKRFLNSHRNSIISISK